MDILSEIIAHKRTEVELQKQSVSPEQLREQVQKLMGSSSAPRHSMRQALASSPTGIIAEFKRRSPSLSILTDEKFFGGSLRDISTARPLVDIPILRKDFIIDEYQLLQARIVGADAVLLIAACLTQKECSTLTTQAHALGLEVLLEIHNPSELPYINKEVDMLGVNNRNLGTFVTDVKNSFRIARQLQQAIGSKKGASDVRNMPILVSESGIAHPETIRSLRAAGFRGFLIGEAFMKTDHPGDTLKDFISPIISQK